MGSGLACRICSGDVTLRIRGHGEPVTAAALSPSAHATGGHGDLLVCRECGTVQQPALPAGSELHDLYRDMTDEAYLGEEAGRRATGARLLDLIAPFAPRGRLLDVGCGPGLLLDEARRRGYATTGLELSRASARHARDALGLDVHELALEDFADSAHPPSFDAVVLADVIEHLDDPVDGIARCAALLKPGGVLCVVTPDPSSATARAAGRR
jgi:2-polyprenyl-3-methyl-5-hydroxy-6-metoxy-1,4-benzoquinol methylase